MKETKNINNINIEKYDFDIKKKRSFFDEFDIHFTPTIVLTNNKNKILWKHTGADITEEMIEEKTKQFGEIVEAIELSDLLYAKICKMGLISLSNNIFGICNTLKTKLDELCGDEQPKNFINK